MTPNTARWNAQNTTSIDVVAEARTSLGSAAVIQGDGAAHQVADALDRAESTIAAVSLADTRWPALAEPLTLLKDFRAFVAKAKGE